MNLHAALLAENSKANIEKIVKAIGNDSEKFKELIHLIFNAEEKAKQRASWVMGYCVINHPELVKPYLKNLIALLNKPVHNALKRNVVRFLQFIDIPEDFQGSVFDTCIKLILNPKEAIAVRAFSMTVCANIAKGYPELKEEVKNILIHLAPEESAGIKSRAKNVLKTLN